MSTWYVANIIGYVRIACLLLATSFHTNLSWFLGFYVSSYALDAVDGPVARALQGTSTLGAVLDMVTDRVSTTLLLSLLNETHWYMCMMLDIAAHWIHVNACCLQGIKHKETKDALLQWYYKPINLFLVCFLNEAFLCAMLVHKTSEVPTELLLLLAPAFLLKQCINCIHLSKGFTALANIL